MWLPFRREFDDAFRANRSLPLKMALGALVCSFVAVITLARPSFQSHQPTSPLFFVLLVGGVAPVGAFAVLALTLKDTIRGSLFRGDKVNPLLRIYFGLGVWSLVLWVPTVIVLTAFIGLFVSMLVLI